MKNSSDNQLFFDFDAPLNVPEKVSEEIPAAEKTQLTVAPCAEIEKTVPAVEAPRKTDKFVLQQAVLAYLVQNGAAGAALQVPCRLRKFQADVAAYYSNYRRRINHLERTVVVDIYTGRNQCLPECAGRDAMLEELAGLRAERAEMEAQIRIDEPHLRAEDELFDEFRSYEYSRSSNKKYHKLCRRIASIQQSLYKGTRMEQLAKADVADYLIMAVPEGMLSKDEIPDNWGLWYVDENRKVKAVVNPELQECSAESRLHLVQNIGHAALNSVLFANGIKVKSNGNVRFTRPPKARRK